VFGAFFGILAVFALTALPFLAAEPLLVIIRAGLAWLLLGAGLLLAPRLIRIFEASRLRRQQAPRLMQQVFTPAGFTPSEEWSQPIPWSHIDQVLETPRGFLIFHAGSTEPVYVPTFTLSLTETERLRHLISTALAASPSRVKLLKRAT
jgi:hypothetical protein